MQDRDPAGAAPPPWRELTRPITNSYIVRDARLVAGEYPGASTDALARKRLSRFLEAGITSFIDLTAPIDPLKPYSELLREMAPHVAYTRLPIADMGIPRVPRMRSILDAIDAALAAEHTVYVHCWGGVGRTGTVVGCWLVRRGLTPDDALAEVRRLFASMSPQKLQAHPEGSPQTAAQREYVRRWKEGMK